MVSQVFHRITKSWEEPRIVDGKVVEHWGQGDTLTLMKQLGIVFFPGPKLLLPILRSLVSP